jgi:major membrane immunogen (membrane-anchored lipoprotein)
MKKTSLFILLLLAVVVSTLAFKSGKQYKDGTYTGESQSKYKAEPYWGQATVEIKNDKVVKFHFQILDKKKNEVFGPKYERHFKDNPEYMQQCRNDLKGIEAYAEKYMKTSDPKQVDAITGATWSYNIFRAALKVALDKAKNN